MFSRPSGAGPDSVRRIDQSPDSSHEMYDVYAILISAGCYGFVVLLRHVLERILSVCR